MLELTRRSAENNGNTVLVEETRKVTVVDGEGTGDRGAVSAP